MKKIAVIVLAGGFGIRTQGVLKNIPKTLVKTSNGKTILNNVLDDIFNNCKLNDIYIISNGIYYQIISDHVNQIYKNKKIIVINNKEKDPQKRLGALGDLLYVINKIKNPYLNYLVLPCDTTYWQSFSIKKFIDFSYKNPDSFTTIVRDVKDQAIIKGRFGCMLLDKNNKVINFVEKPKKPQSTLAASPFYMYRQKHISLLKYYLKLGKSPDHPGSFIPFLIEKNADVRALVVDNLIVDAGTPEDIEKAKKY